MVAASVHRFGQLARAGQLHDTAARQFASHVVARNTSGARSSYSALSNGSPQVASTWQWSKYQTRALSSSVSRWQQQETSPSSSSPSTPASSSSASTFAAKGRDTLTRASATGTKPHDPRPFRKQYPPVRPQPKPINFDQPAIPNPKETAAAHDDFRRKSRIAGMVLLGALASGSIIYFVKDSVHLDSPQKSPVKGLELPQEEMEKQVREAQKAQANATNFALLALSRSSTIAKAVGLCMWDYRRTLGKTYSSREEEAEELRQCHLRSANRILVALQANGGLYVKLGQHLSAIILLPLEWTTTLRPLQDQNHPTPLPELEAMFRTETGMTFAEAFSEIDPKPIGVASLAQVHRAVDRKTGQALAIKMMHPDVERFSEVDMKTVTVLVKWVKKLFPDFSFEWLADEMNENMPLEMDFRHEAQNARRAEADFAHYRTTSVYIPKVTYVYKRVMAMEFIDGRRPDDLRYLAEHNIDRNRVSQELSRVFSQMLYLHGFFHADPHGGNVLIRPKQPGSRSRHNFEVVLLDHGLYFDIDEELRANYARFWLSLLKQASPAVTAERRRYAKLIADIDDELYPILESAITGRAGLEGSDPSNPNGVKDRNRASSLLDMDGGANLTDDEQEHIRKTVMEKEGLFLSILDLLRRLPRRMLMVLKLNDLTRSLDASLHTTHGSTRPFLVAARLCALAVYNNDLKHLKERRSSGKASLLTSLTLWKDYVKAWWSYVYFNRGLAMIEIVSDVRARWMQIVQFGANRVGRDGSAEKAKLAATGQQDQAEKDERDQKDRERARLALEREQGA
ncbi:ABC1-domain-containing protein [Testicularia cyperi]|uniref:ABC1-domain-containing protein n=1 Tax=Testicularia cyperi TaxID=1882483 RepID=A0A317XLJ0_9BASI|nr:ABC1-domain-containing protein [Testicularia cyperi]